MVTVADVRGNAGVVQTARRRETGRVVTVYDGRLADLDTDNGRAPYSTVCEDHGWIICHATRALAIYHASNPLGWCDICNGSYTEED